MKRKNKNVLLLIILLVVICLTIFTVYYATKKDYQTIIVTSSTKLSEENSLEEVPEKPEGETEEGEEPPEKPDGDTIEGETPSSEEPPDKPDGDTELTPDGEISGENMPSEESDILSTNQSTTKKLASFYYCLFAVEALLISLIITYLVLSKFNQRNFKETFVNFDKIIIYLLSNVILTTLIFMILMFVSNNLLEEESPTTSTTVNNTTTSSVNGASVIDGTTETLSGEYETSEVDTSVILVQNGGYLTLSNALVTKSGGASSNTENSEFYGVNAGILVTEGTAIIDSSTITTNATGSNAVFATGENSKIYISNSTIITYASASSRGLDATYGGYIEAENVSITTTGGSCATLATDRGEGTVIASSSTLETNGSGSPLIYSTGDISIYETSGTAYASQMVVIEGKNSAVVTNSSLEATGAGNRGDVDIAGVMIYQSMSGDADEGVGTFSSVESSLTILESSSYYSTAPMFFVTNTKAIINLEDTTLNFGSGILLSVKSTSEWGTVGSNGGDVEFNAINEDLSGEIIIDEYSSLELNLTSSTFKGSINSENASSNIYMTIDANSSFTLTADTYISGLTNLGTINLNGYTLYVNDTIYSN